MHLPPRRPAYATLLALACLAGRLPARADDPPAPAAPPVAPPAAPPVAAPAEPAAQEPKITLVEPGAEPRTKLRYAFEKGEPQTTELRMEMSQEVLVNGQSSPGAGMPPLRMTLRTSVEAVHDDGSASMRWEMLEMKMEAPEGMPPERAQAMEEMFSKMRFTARVEMTGRGLVKSSQIDLPADVTGQARQVLEQMATQMKDSIGESAALLPEEAVGVGGTWRVEVAKKTPQGLAVKGTNLCKVGAMEAGRATIETKVSLEAPEQDFALPNLPAGTMAHLRSMSGGGTAKILFDPKVVMPETDMHMNVDMKMSIDVGTGTAMEMTSKQTISMAMRAKK